MWGWMFEAERLVGGYVVCWVGSSVVWAFVVLLYPASIPLPSVPVGASYSSILSLCSCAGADCALWTHIWAHASVLANERPASPCL